MKYKSDILEMIHENETALTDGSIEKQISLAAV